MELARQARAPVLVVSSLMALATIAIVVFMSAQTSSDHFTA
jgi:hypothetical protein